ncbi:S-layer homology domain-containing protein [Cytobacillus sp. IB215316]|uniref:S-layer homology domain-containing protein n=1 Tax=Cytobacillus sp. IB215316 TaxID=3097354 RepID=UPI002A145232|nr:S-layer homology domain-containing protein [Cytobacillus sp. IB215316]MDX8361181.1 S-layer homology domain-containing protein [Cytobacillus sp. IB215316]
MLYKKGFLLCTITGLLITSACSQEQKTYAGKNNEVATAEWTEQELGEVAASTQSVEDKVTLLEKEVEELLISSEQSTEQPVFNDVQADYWAFGEVMKLYKQGIISGYPAEQLFKPENTITRAQAAKMIVIALDLPLSKTPSVFNDVEPGNWAEQLIMTAFEHGLIDGNNGSFMPNEPMQRKHMAVALQKGFQLQPLDDSFTEYVDVTNDNSDGDIYEAIKIVTQHGIATGSNGYFNPSEPTKRSQFSAFLVRALERD